MTTAKLDVMGQRWVASLVNYNFKTFYKSGKLNVEADALSQIPWKNTHVNHMEPLIVKAMLQFEVGNKCGYTRSVSSAECCTEKFGCG